MDADQKAKVAMAKKKCIALNVKYKFCWWALNGFRLVNIFIDLQHFVDANNLILRFNEKFRVEF